MTGFLIRTALCILMAAQVTAASAGEIRQTIGSKGSMTITAINYGDAVMSGDAILVSSAGEDLLMDTGYPDDQEDPDQSAVIRYLKRTGVDHPDLYISHWHNDHYGLVTTILRDPFFHVGRIYVPESSEELAYADPSHAGETWYANLLLNIGDPEKSRVTHSYHEILETADELGVEVVWLDEGSTFQIGDARGEVLWHRQKNYPYGQTVVPYLNDRSLVTMITCGNIRYLTCGDLHLENERAILEAGIDVHADIYKASHHADVTSNCEEWLEAVDPDYILSTRQKMMLGTTYLSGGWYGSGYPIQSDLPSDGTKGGGIRDIDESRNVESRLAEYGTLLNEQERDTVTLRVADGIITLE